jgi:hypothetical protein
MNFQYIWDSSTDQGAKQAGIFDSVFVAAKEYGVARQRISKRNRKWLLCVAFFGCPHCRTS